MAAPRTKLPALHPISRRHVERLLIDVVGTDIPAVLEAGATPLPIADPEPAAAPAVDNVARAIQVDLLQARTLGWEPVTDSLRRGLDALEAAFDEPTGRFRTHRGPDGRWTEGQAPNDSLGRVMLALGETIEAAPDELIVERAGVLFARALKAAGRVLSLRGQAAVVLGCAAVARSFAAPRKLDQRTLPHPAPHALDARETALRDEAKATLRRMATGLHARVLDHARSGWPWPEQTLASESAILPRALIVGGRAVDADVMLRIGRQVLDWLLEVQTAPEGHLTLIGGAGWPRNGDRPTFEQLPIDATALLLAAEAAHDATGDPRYAAVMESAYGWFLGANDRRRRLVDAASGACASSLTATGKPGSETAESTLLWLVSLEHIRALRRPRPAAAHDAAPPPAAPTGLIRARTVRATPAELRARMTEPAVTG